MMKQSYSGQSETLQSGKQDFSRKNVCFSDFLLSANSRLSTDNFVCLFL